MTTSISPKGWDLQPLGKICDVRDGTHDSPKYVTDGFPLVTSKNLSDGYIDLTTANHISEDDYERINKRSRVHKGDILMPMIGTIGSPVLVEDVPQFAIKNIALIKPNYEDVSIRYVFQLLRSPYLDRIIQKNGRGGTQKFLSLGAIRSIPIPFPHLDEQKRIADILDKADAIRRKRAQALELTDQFLQSVFLDMFGDPVTNPKGWEKRTLQSLSSGDLSNGFFAKNTEYVDDGTPIAWISDLLDRLYVNCTDLKKVRASANDLKKYSLRYGDVLFCRSSLTVAGIGKASIVPPDCPEGTLFECHIIKLPLDKRRISPEFFGILSNTPGFRAQVMSRAKTSTMTTISQDGVQSCEVIVPPIELQLEFQEVVASFHQSTDARTRASQEVEILFQSLVQRAFRGEL